MTESDTAQAEQYGVLTDEAIARSRLRLGVPQQQLNPPHNYEVTADGARHFAYGYGDDNPLYCDPEYAAGTRWGSLIAPPNFLYTMGEDAAPKPDPETKALLKGDPFGGLGSYQAVMDFEWWRPLQLGDTCKVLQAQVGVQPKPSSFGGRTVHITHDYLYTNGRGEMHAVRRGTWINAERHTSRKRAKEKLEQIPYTDEQIAEIEAAYAARPVGAPSRATSRTCKSAISCSRESRGRSQQPMSLSGIWVGACSSLPQAPSVSPPGSAARHPGCTHATH